MCFYIDPSEPDMKIAKREIRVYKNVILQEDGSVESFHRLYPYRVNEKQKELSLSIEPSKLNKTLSAIYRGYHSFSTLKEAISNKNYFWEEPTKIAVFSIPKGSSYYINRKLGEIVSSNIIFKHIWEEKK